MIYNNRWVVRSKVSKHFLKCQQVGSASYALVLWFDGGAGGLLFLVILLLFSLYIESWLFFLDNLFIFKQENKNWRERYFPKLENDEWWKPNARWMMGEWWIMLTAIAGCHRIVVLNKRQTTDQGNRLVLRGDLKYVTISKRSDSKDATELPYKT